MKHKIPNTNLILTEVEIQAVVDYAYSISMGKTSTKNSNESKKSVLVSSYNPNTDGMFELPQDKSIFINYGNHNDQA